MGWSWRSRRKRWSFAAQPSARRIRISRVTKEGEWVGPSTVWRSAARPIVVCLLSVPQMLWLIASEWPMRSPAVIAEVVVLVIGAGTGAFRWPRWLQASGLGLLLGNPCVAGLMIGVLGSVTPYGRTGIEVFSVFGFAEASAFVCGYWLNRWLATFESRRGTSLSTRALLAAVLALCAPSILGALGGLLLKVSYPGGLIPADSPWGTVMIWVMMASTPAILTGPGLLVLAAPLAVHLARTRGLSSGSGRAAVSAVVAALVSAAFTL
jgi:hypothetical protein